MRVGCRWDGGVGLDSHRRGTERRHLDGRRDRVQLLIPDDDLEWLARPLVDEHQIGDEAQRVHARAQVCRGVTLTPHRGRQEHHEHRTKIQSLHIRSPDKVMVRR